MKKQLFIALSFAILTGISYQACSMENEDSMSDDEINTELKKIEDLEALLNTAENLEKQFKKIIQLSQELDTKLYQHDSLSETELIEEIEKLEKSDTIGVLCEKTENLSRKSKEFEALPAELAKEVNPYNPYNIFKSTVVSATTWFNRTSTNQNNKK